MKRTTQFFLIFCLLMISGRALTQTTTFDYVSSSLSTSDCNLFDPPVIINSKNHVALSGGVAFSSTDGLLLTTAPQPPAKAVSFYIDFGFSTSYKYVVKITAKGSPAFILKAAVVSSLSSYPASVPATCNPDDEAQAYNISGAAAFISAGLKAASETYSTAEFTPSATHQYLVVWGTGGNPSLSLDQFSISKIEIVATLVAPTFTISPSSLSLSCGTTPSAQVFTVANVAGTPGVTDYTWNLGPVPNGWILGGSPAPATYSTGSANSITLTPACGVKPANVSATVTAGGVGYQTSPVNVTSSGTPTFSTINGSNIICSSETYSIPDLPCGASVVWTAEPAAIASLSCSTCDQTTISLVGTPDASLFITATITSCGITQSVTKKVRAGAYPDYYGVIEGPTYLSTNSVYSFSVNAANYPGVSNLSWSPPSGWLTITSGSNYVVLRTPSSSPPSASLILNAESCGTPFVTAKQVFFTSFFRIAPNPVKDVITVEEVDQRSGQAFNRITIQKVEVINNMGKVYYKADVNTKGSNRLTIPATNLPPDIYYLRIFNGKDWQSVRFVVTK